MRSQTIIMLLVIGLVLGVLRDNRPPALAVPKPEHVANAGSDPVCVGWDEGWLVYRYSVAKDKWSTWKSPAAAVPSTAFAAVSPRAAAVLVPLRGFSGWLVDLPTGKWKEVPSSPMGTKTKWVMCAAVGFVDHRLLVWGYTGQLTKDESSEGEILDTRTMEWTAISKAPICARYRCPHALIGKKLIVWGGYGRGSRAEGSSGPLNDGAVYDVTKDSWEKMPEAPIKFEYGIASGVWRDRFVLFGGRTRDRFTRVGAIYDPGKRSWEKMKEAPFDVGVQSAFAISGDRLFLWSGDKPGVEQPAAEDGAVYDFRKREWKKIAKAPIQGRYLTLARPFGSKVMVWGGWVSSRGSGGMTFLRDGAIYDLDKDTWEKIPDMPGSIPNALHPGW